MHLNSACVFCRVHGSIKNGREPGSPCGRLEHSEGRLEADHSMVSKSSPITPAFPWAPRWALQQRCHQLRSTAAGEGGEGRMGASEKKGHGHRRPGSTAGKSEGRVEERWGVLGQPMKTHVSRGSKWLTTAFCNPRYEQVSIHISPDVEREPKYCRRAVPFLLFHQSTCEDRVA